MSADRSTDGVTREFFDFVNYNVCRAVSEFVGAEKAVKLYERAGEIGYAELKRRGIIQVDGRDPLDVLVQIVRFLERGGYMGRIELKRLNEREMEVDMYGVSVMESSVRLTNEGYAPSHFMTNLMFAALKDFGMTAELDELVFEEEVDHVREHWVLAPAG